LSNKVYIIKHETLVDLFDRIREVGGFSNDEEKELLSLEQAKILLEELGTAREDYVGLLNKVSGSTLVIPREIEIIPYIFLKERFPYVEYLKWE
jgi:hypothetical protein